MSALTSTTTAPPTGVRAVLASFGPSGLIAGGVVIAIVLVAIFAPLIAPYPFDAQDIPSRLQGPSAEHLMGTDHFGRDILSRIIYGTRIALSTALPAIGMALGVGILLGLSAGYLGGLFDTIVLLLLDTLQAFPGVILALAILALTGPASLVYVLAVTFIPGYARVIRAQVLSAREQSYVQAERNLGAGSMRILLRHILPNVIAPVIVLAAMDIPTVITLEAGLSFLGLGVPPPAPSWGVMLSEGFQYMRQAPWQIIAAGAALVITTLSITLFGESLQRSIDPRSAKGTR